MNKSITFITGNAKKAEQLSWYLEHEVAHVALDIPEIQSTSVEEVAIAKAGTAYQQLGTPVIVEDTALIFTALNGLPGPFIKFFLEDLGNEGMCRMLDGFSDRSVIARTCFALCDDTGVHTFIGERRGTVPEHPRGETDFGWNPIFIPEGETKTWAEMTREEGAKTSMRRLAIEKLQQYLEVHY